MARALRMVVTVCGVLPLAWSCGSDATTSQAPTVLVLPDDAATSMYAKVGGVLGVNEQDCVTLDDRVLVVPKGSRALDEQSIELAGLGTVRVGERLSGGGGLIDGADEVDYFVDGHDLDADEVARCQPDGAEPSLTVFTP